MSYLDEHPEEVKNASYYRRQLKKAEAERDELRKWKEEAEKQEAVGYAVFNGFVLFTTTNSIDRAETIAKNEQMRHDLSGSLVAFHVRPLYTKPIPSPDVAELQKKIEELGYALAAKGTEETVHLQMEVAELERKLAEQQAKLHTVFSVLCGGDKLSVRESMVFNSVRQDTYRELNTLLAQAREEGRKEGAAKKGEHGRVMYQQGCKQGRKEGIQQVYDEWKKSWRDSNGMTFISSLELMLSAAQKKGDSTS